MGALSSVSMVSWGSPMLTNMLKIMRSKYCLESGHLVQFFFFFISNMFLNGSFIPSLLFSLSYPSLMLKDIDAVKCLNLLLNLWTQIVMLPGFHGLFFRCITLSKGGKSCLPYFTGSELWCLHCEMTELGREPRPLAGILHFQWFWWAYSCAYS